MLDDLGVATDAGEGPRVEVTSEMNPSTGMDSHGLVDDPSPSASAAATEPDESSDAPTNAATSDDAPPDAGTGSSHVPGTDTETGPSAQPEAGTEPLVPEESATPELVEVAPPPGSADVALDAHFVLDFSVEVRPGNGDLILSEADGLSIVERLAVTDARVTFVAQRVTVDWETSLSFNTAYAVSVDEGAILADTTSAPPWPADVSFAFTTVPPPAVELLSTSPVNQAAQVDPNANLVLSFSEAVDLGEGDIELWSETGTLVERFGAGDSTIVVSGSSVTIYPSQALENASSYYVTLQPAAVLSGRGAVFPGFESTTTFAFTTAEAPPPPLLLSTTVPQNEEANVALDAVVTLSFAESIRAGIGALAIIDADTGLPFESAMATDARVSVSASTATFTPSAPLAPATTYYVTVDAGSFESFAGASFAGIEPNALRFTTRGIPASCREEETESPSGDCYYLQATAATFADAIGLCAARGSNWHLAEPRSAAEQSAIQGLISADTWIGASDIEAEGMWQWLSDDTSFWVGDVGGEPVEDAYTRWSSIEPTGGSQDCGRIGWSSDPQGWYWADSPCDYHYHTLCQGPKE